MVDDTILEFSHAMRLTPGDGIGVPLFSLRSSNALYVAQTDLFHRIIDFHLLDRHSYHMLVEMPQAGHMPYWRGCHISIPFWLDGKSLIASSGDLDCKWRNGIPKDRLESPIIKDVVAAIRRTSEVYKVTSRNTKDKTEEFINTYENILKGTPQGTNEALGKYIRALTELDQNRETFLASQAGSTEPYAEILLLSKAREWITRHLHGLSPEMRSRYFEAFGRASLGEKVEPADEIFAMEAIKDLDRNLPGQWTGAYLHDFPERKGSGYYNYLINKGVSSSSAAFTLAIRSMHELNSRLEWVRKSRAQFQGDANAFLDDKEELSGQPRLSKQDWDEKKTSRANYRFEKVQVDTLNRLISKEYKAEAARQRSFEDIKVLAHGLFGDETLGPEGDRKIARLGSDCFGPVIFFAALHRQLASVSSELVMRERIENLLKRYADTMRTICQLVHVEELDSSGWSVNTHSQSLLESVGLVRLNRNNWRLL